MQEHSEALVFCWAPNQLESIRSACYLKQRLSEHTEFSTSLSLQRYSDAFSAKFLGRCSEAPVKSKEDPGKENS